MRKTHHKVVHHKVTHRKVAKVHHKTLAQRMTLLRHKGKLYVKDKAKDHLYKAKPLGKRTSASGKVYYEYRLNRADVNRKNRL